MYSASNFYFSLLRLKIPCRLQQCHYFSAWKGAVFSPRTEQPFLEILSHLAMLPERNCKSERKSSAVITIELSLVNTCVTIPVICPFIWMVVYENEKIRDIVWVIIKVLCEIHYSSEIQYRDLYIILVSIEFKCVFQGRICVGWQVKLLALRKSFEMEKITFVALVDKLLENYNFVSVFYSVALLSW